MAHIKQILRGKLANQPVQVRLAQEPAISANTGLKSRLEIDILRVD